MRTDLANARMGQLVGADRRTYSMTGVALDRAEVEALIERGCPVVTYLPGGRLLWDDEDDAWPAWADARRERVSAGRWEAADGSLLVVVVLHD
ncbi:hypothetical protein DQ244_18605 [Blastococcus sp. TBT05-19]|uniref:hypothetical protein n=1 Tax=Blastococcus sp. TBT05-19 TaxID=2250581 RepID=UPI000DEB154D|nr:hypothetical protein [Blastococcus sp. TBT05-19]RBY86689.1 hypothetical protein DQ244_18605 [Blastococcus sp. TBT05-19]